MDDRKKFTLSLIAAIIFAVCGTAIYMTNKLSLRGITATKSCADIFTLKQRSYFTEVTKNRFIYNQKLNTCLLFSHYEDPASADQRYVVVDMVSDNPLFVYILKSGKDVDDAYGLTKDQALEKIRSYGFAIF